MHINGSFHSSYSRWRRLRVQDAEQVLALSGEMCSDSSSTNTSSASDPFNLSPTLSASCSKANVTKKGSKKKRDDQKKKEAEKEKQKEKEKEKPKEQKKRNLTFYCPYPFCASINHAGFKSLDELVAHVEGSSEDAESLNHEQQKWVDGWGGEGWVINERAGEMVKEVLRR